MICDIIVRTYFIRPDSWTFHQNFPMLSLLLKATFRKWWMFCSSSLLFLIIKFRLCFHYVWLRPPPPLPSQRKEKKFLKNMNDKNVFLIEINPKASDTLMVHVNSCCVLVGNIGWSDGKRLLSAPSIFLNILEWTSSHVWVPRTSCDPGHDWFHLPTSSITPHLIS